MHRHFLISKKKKKKEKQVQLKPDQQNPNLQELGCLSFPTCTSFPPAFRTTCVLRHFQPLRDSAAIFDHRHQNPATTKVEALLRSPETQVAIQLPLHSLCCFFFFFFCFWDSCVLSACCVLLSAFAFYVSRRPNLSPRC